MYDRLCFRGFFALKEVSMDKKELSNLKDFWDSMAERFKDFEIPTPYNVIFM